VVKIFQLQIKVKSLLNDIELGFFNQAFLENGQAGR
jgi:hypothetical protein